MLWSGNDVLLFLTHGLLLVLKFLLMHLFVRVTSYYFSLVIYVSKLSKVARLLNVDGNKERLPSYLAHPFLFWSVWRNRHEDGMRIKVSLKNYSLLHIL